MCHALFCVTSWAGLRLCALLPPFVVIFQQIGYFIELLKQQAVFPPSPLTSTLSLIFPAT